MNKLLLLLVALLLCIAPVAATVANYSIVFDTTDRVTTNVSYINAQQSATPLPVAAGVAILGIILLIISIVYKPESGADILSILSVPPLLVSAWQFLSIDIVTGFGVTSQAMNITGIKDTAQTWSPWFVLMENHTIYALYPVSILLVILLVIAILNVYRVLMITNMEMKGPDRLGGNSRGGYKKDDDD